MTGLQLDNHAASNSELQRERGYLASLFIDLSRGICSTQDLKEMF